MLERESEILDTFDTASMNDTCAKWNAYADEVALVQDDSGL